MVEARGRRRRKGIGDVFVRIYRHIPHSAAQFSLLGSGSGKLSRQNFLENEIRSFFSSTDSSRREISFFPRGEETRREAVLKRCPNDSRGERKKKGRERFSISINHMVSLRAPHHRNLPSFRHINAVTTVTETKEKRMRFQFDPIERLFESFFSPQSGSRLRDVVN